MVWGLLWNSVVLSTHFQVVSLSGIRHLGKLLSSAGDPMLLVQGRVRSQGVVLVMAQRLDRPSTHPSGPSTGRGRQKIPVLQKHIDPHLWWGFIRSSRYLPESPGKLVKHESNKLGPCQDYRCLVCVPSYTHFQNHLQGSATLNSLSCSLAAASALLGSNA